MNKKVILIITIIIVVLGLISYWFLFRKKEPVFTFQSIIKGTVTQEVSETGSVKVSEKTNLGFKNSGRIRKVYVGVGDKVEAGQSLAQLDTVQLYIELDKANAGLEIAEAKSRDTEVSFKNAGQDLEDVKAEAKENLDNAYGDALIVLDSSYLKIYNAYNAIYKIQRDYFTSFDEKSTEVIEEKYKTKGNLERTETRVNDAKNNPQEENIDLALSKIKGFLEAVNSSLEVIRDATESTAYRARVSTTDKTSLDTQRTNISNAITDLVNTQQTISTTKITNETDINSAEARVSELKKQLGENEGVSSLYQAQINQAQTEVKLLEDKIAEAVLKAPNNGQITAVNKRGGEMVQPTVSVISFLPAAPFQIEVDIYEEDIVKVKIGDPVNIDLISFPDQTLKGRVASIDPAEKIIGGVVYYKVTIDFLEIKEGVKQGMTADITINTNKKENVLLVPKEAIENINGQKMVKVRQNNEIETRKIETELEGEDFFEVISGLKEGEEVVTGNKI